MTQSDLQPFYTPPTPLEGKPGDLAAASGMAFIPTAPSSQEPRPVIAWTHATVGEGDACAPSRTDDPTSQLTQFVPSMIQLGWALVATDYTGLGTPEVQAYLLKDQEVRDTVNSVRALQQVPNSHVGSRYAVFGHSQVGQTALWTGHLSKEFAPELDLLAVAAAAPAAEMPLLIIQGTADEIVLSQPNAYLQKTWCEAGTNISALWLGGVGNTLAPAIGGPTAVGWLQKIFAGTVPRSACGDPIPVLPPLE